MSKQLCCSLSDLNTQQSLLTSTKAISVASGQLVTSGKDVQRYKQGDAATSATKSLNTSTQVMSCHIDACQVDDI